MMPVKMTTTIRGSHRYTSLARGRSVVDPESFTVVDDIVVVLLNVKPSATGEATIVEISKTTIGQTGKCSSVKLVDNNEKIFF